MKGKLLKLEGLRGFAAIYVALGHTFARSFRIGNVDLSVVLRFGQEAVILFFLLSGFVIYYAFEKSSDKSFGLYFTKRFLRIYIPLTCAFALNILFLWQQTGNTPQIDGGQLLGNLFMLQDAVSLKTNVVTGPFLGNSPLWSLSYEWWFYMIFFVIITWFRPKASLIAYSLGILAALTYVVYPFFVNRFVMYLILWWAGADMARNYLDRKDFNFTNLKIPLSAITICTGILIFNAWLNHEAIAEQLGMKSIGISPFLEVRHFGFGLIAMVVAILWKKLDWAGWKYTIAPFERIANISFGVYILHWFMVAQATYLSFIRNRFIEYVLYFAICFGAAYVIERMIYPALNGWIVNRIKARKRVKPE